MPILMQQLAYLAREAQEQGECAKAHGNDKVAAYWFNIEEHADKLADVLDEALGMESMG